jgi:hypothetical protein
VIQGYEESYEISHYNKKKLMLACLFRGLTCQEEFITRVLRICRFILYRLVSYEETNVVRVKRLL